MAGPWALATAALYLVLKSNGLRHSKNLPVKFSFSPKTIPADIAKKLPPQRCSKPLFIPFFNVSHKRPTFAFTSESGYTLGFRRRIAHKGTHGETGAFPLSATAQSCAANRIALNAAFATLDSATLLYTYISRFSVTPPLSATALSQTIFHRVFQLLAQMAHVRSHRRKWVHPRFCSEDRTQGHTRRNRGRFRWGWYHCPRSVPRVSETLRGQGVERQTLPLLGLGGGALEERRKPSGQRCAYARRCSEASRPRWAA